MHLLSILSIGLLGLQVSAGPLPSAGNDRVQPNPLKPIRVEEFEHLNKRAIENSMKSALDLSPIREDDLIPPSLRKRAGDVPDYSRLDLVEKTKMYYGGMASNKSMYLANMTLYAPSGEPLIMMERFDALTDHIDCGEGDDIIELKFKTKEAMDYAIHAWEWVNEDAQDCFIMIANSKSCGPEDQRYPYRITDVDYDEEKLITTLKSSRLVWDEVASDFDIDLGRADIPQSSQGLSKRGFWDIFPSLKFDKSVEWDISTNTQGRHNIYTDPFHEFAMISVDCVDCFLAGSIEFAGHIEVKGFDIKELYFSAKPKDVQARLELEIHILAGIPKPGLDLKQTLFELGIPGLSIPGIFTLGPALKYEVGFQIAMYGIANFSIGLDARLPNDAAVVADLLNSGNSGAHGFEKTTVDPILDLNDLSVTVNTAVYTQPVLSFGISVLNSFKYEAALQLKLPYINADLTVGYNENGLCTQGENEVKTGVKARSGASIELWFVAGATSGPTFIPNFNNKLWGIRWPFFDICIPFDIPGLLDGEPDHVSSTIEVTAVPTSFSAIEATEGNVAPTQSFTNVHGPPASVPAATTTAVSQDVSPTTTLEGSSDSATITTAPQETTTSVNIGGSSEAIPTVTSLPSGTNGTYHVKPVEPPKNDYSSSYASLTFSDIEYSSTVSAPYNTNSTTVTGVPNTKPPCTKGLKPTSTLLPKPATTSLPSYGHRAARRRRSLNAI